MRPRKLTAADVCEVTGYTRFQLRGLHNRLRDWPAPAARSAREYSASDLILLNVIHELDVRVGLRRKQIALALPALRKVLSGPREIATSARLVVSFSPLRIEYVGREHQVMEGLVISLDPIFTRVDLYMGVARPAAAQNSLPLEPGLVRSKRRKASA